MHQLDQQKRMAALDRQRMAQSIESIGLQCQQAWDDMQRISVPASYRSVRSIVVAGMGGSGLGAHLFEALFSRRLPIPYQIVNGYRLPGSVNRNSLCILSSYSGTTEEIVAAGKEARRRRAKIFILCAGGTLAQLARRYRLPAYVYQPRFNPSNQPRMAAAYPFVALIALCKQLGFISFSANTFRQAVQSTVALHRQHGLKSPFRRNPTKQLAAQLAGRTVMVIGAEHLSGNAHVMANQINENGKNFSGYYLIPEMNHHLMEGLRFPKGLPRQVAFLFLRSPQYPARIAARFAITRRVLARAHLPGATMSVRAPSPLGESLAALLQGSYLGYYLAMLNRIDPSPIPVVDYFKRQLH